jgi:hypothetical protein
MTASCRLRVLVMVAVLLSLLTVDKAYGQASGTTSAQEHEASNSVPTNTTEPEGDDTSDGGAGAVKAKHFLSDFEFWLSFEILLFGLGVIVVEFMLLRHAKLTAEEALRVYAVTLIIVGTLFAITAGFGSTQIAPAMGLFGTIAGYLLGKRTSESVKQDKGENEP